MSIGPLLFSFFGRTLTNLTVPQTSIEPADYAYLLLVLCLFVTSSE